MVCAFHLLVRNEWKLDFLTKKKKKDRLFSYDQKGIKEILNKGLVLIFVFKNNDNKKNKK